MWIYLIFCGLKPLKVSRLPDQRKWGHPHHHPASYSTYKCTQAGL